jgi:hypothetical protein
MNILNFIVGIVFAASKSYKTDKEDCRPGLILLSIFRFSFQDRMFPCIRSSWACNIRRFCDLLHRPGALNLQLDWDTVVRSITVSTMKDLSQLRIWKMWCNGSLEVPWPAFPGNPASIRLSPRLHDRFPVKPNLGYGTTFLTKTWLSDQSVPSKMCLADSEHGSSTSRVLNPLYLFDGL